MRITREQFLENRLHHTEIWLLRTAIGGWIGWAGFLITLAVILDRLPG